LQRWLQKHAHNIEVLQLHQCSGTVLTALPCPKLQHLLLQNADIYTITFDTVGVCDSRVWGDIAAASKLTSVLLGTVETASQQADVVSALTALPDLEQLIWRNVCCSDVAELSDSSLLQHTTRLTALELQSFAAAALQHLGSLTKLQHLSISCAADWAAAGCPGLQELKTLTRLELLIRVDDIPHSVSQLTALQQLDVFRATPTALNKLQALTGLTQLSVDELSGLSLESPPLQLPGLQHLVFGHGAHDAMPMSFLGSCTQLRVLALWMFEFGSPGSLVASTLLQHLELYDCGFVAADGAARPASWQQVFPGPGRLPHLTSLRLHTPAPDLQQADMECLVACCSSLQVLHLDVPKVLIDSLLSAMARLSGLTSLHLRLLASDQQCSLLAQLTGLRELNVGLSMGVSAAGLRQLRRRCQTDWCPSRWAAHMLSSTRCGLSQLPVCLCLTLCVGGGGGGVWWGVAGWGACGACFIPIPILQGFIHTTLPGMVCLQLVVMLVTGRWCASRVGGGVIAGYLELTAICFCNTNVSTNFFRTNLEVLPTVGSCWQQ